MAKCVNDEVVCSMIHRAGKELRSLKLGRVACQAIPSLRSSGLVSLFSNHGYFLDLPGSLEKLNNLVSMGTKSLCALLSVCPNLTDLKIVNL
ncbi:unnamed protein product [Arabis nemorensis]|uniref:Uncharacterized protein n=1 Tax=Arabis nemorensis TaxID=586526 RepID=A0A565BKV3_9BRAS|nr:unnamed protein product [Arabis nemorensis]